MFKYLKTWTQLKNDRRGVTMMEYAIMGALIAVVAVGAVATLGNNVSAKMGAIGTAVGTTN
jgi:pilus assembly protein Flp/PilA